MLGQTMLGQDIIKLANQSAALQITAIGLVQVIGTICLMRGQDIIVQGDYSADLLLTCIA